MRGIDHISIPMWRFGARSCKTMTMCSHPGIAQYSQHISLRQSPAQQQLWRLIQEQPNSMLSSTPEQSQFLGMMCKTINAKRILEVGVFMGYTTLSIAEANPGAEVVALDISEVSVDMGRPYWKLAGVESQVSFHLGPALQTMESFKHECFDFVFIDADKANYQSYYEQAIRLTRSGGLIAVDNVFWKGRVLDVDDSSRQTTAIRHLNSVISSDTRLSALSTVPFADGLTLCMKN